MKRIDNIVPPGAWVPISEDIASVLLSQAFHKDSFQGCLFLDMETTGLRASEGYVYLIGCLYLWDDPSTGRSEWKQTQFFCKGWGEELLLLKTFFAFASAFDTIITFHGSRFDIPFLTQCAREYHLDNPLTDKKMVELYGLLRPCRKLFPTEHIRFSDLEALCGLTRNEATAGGDLVVMYEQYVTQADETTMQRLLLHNQEDVQHLYQLLPLLQYPFLLEGTMTPATVSITPELAAYDATQNAVFTVAATLPYPIPRDVCVHHAAYHLQIKGCRLTLTLFPGQTKKYLYFSDYRNYFYIPAEDYAIHKSLAGLIPAGQRQKATPQTCYQGARDCFLPLPGAEYFESGNNLSKTNAPFAILYDAPKSSLGYVRLGDAQRFSGDYLQRVLQGVLSLYMQEL